MGPTSRTLTPATYVAAFSFLVHELQHGGQGLATIGYSSNGRYSAVLIAVVSSSRQGGGWELGICITTNTGTVCLPVRTRALVQPQNRATYCFVSS